MLAYWVFTRIAGALFGFAALHAHDEGLWDDALLKGVMRPSPSPEARFKFLVLCTLFPELPVAGILYRWLHRDR